MKKHFVHIVITDTYGFPFCKGFEGYLSRDGQITKQKEFARPFSSKVKAQEEARKFKDTNWIASRSRSGRKGISVKVI